MAGRWAAKEAVSKVLGLGVRGIGWRDIEIERLPTGQPAVRLHGRAAARAEQLGMGRIAVSITPRVRLRGRDGLRRADGRWPLPVPARHRGSPRRSRAPDPGPHRAPARPGRGRMAPLPSRADAPRTTHGATRTAVPERPGPRLRPARGPVRAPPRRAARTSDRGRPARRGSTRSSAAALLPRATGPRPQGLVRQAARRSPARSTTPARRCSSAGPPAAPGSAS